jgi:hypothetical protein
MSQENVEIVRSIAEDWAQGDFGSSWWAHPDVEFVHADGPAPSRWTGLAGLAEGTRAWLAPWQDLRWDVDEYRELDDKRVLVLCRFEGRGKASGVELAQMHAKGATLFCVRDSKVTKIVLYLDRERAFADLGLKE